MCISWRVSYWMTVISLGCIVLFAILSKTMQYECNESFYCPINSQTTLINNCDLNQTQYCCSQSCWEEKKSTRINECGDDCCSLLERNVQYCSQQWIIILCYVFSGLCCFCCCCNCCADKQKQDRQIAYKKKQKQKLNQQPKYNTCQLFQASYEAHKLRNKASNSAFTPAEGQVQMYLSEVMANRAQKQRKKLQRKQKYYNFEEQNDQNIPSDYDQSESSLQPNFLPFKGIQGRWVEGRHFNSKRKAFGFYQCKTCNRSWMYNHAKKYTKQSCKICKKYSYPTYLWQNKYPRKNRKQQFNQ